MLLMRNSFSSASASSTSSSHPLPNLLLPLNLLLLLLLLLSPIETQGNDDSQFFQRNAKWINLPSGGGSLVSGRGNFRPGFHSSLQSQSLLAEPLFAIKRSNPRIPSVAMFADPLIGADPLFAAFARRRR